MTRCACPHQTARHRHVQCRGRTLVRHIAYGYAPATVWQRKYVVKIASHFTRRAPIGGEMEAGEVGQYARQQTRLHFTRHLQFAFELRALRLGDIVKMSALEGHGYLCANGGEELQIRRGEQL